MILQIYLMLIPVAALYFFWVTTRIAAIHLGRKNKKLAKSEFKKFALFSLVHAFVWPLWLVWFLGVHCAKTFHRINGTTYTSVLPKPDDLEDVFETEDIK